MLRIISLGAGVQSTTLALMAMHGEIGPMPDVAIFADTGDEPAAVYAHLERLEKILPFPVHRVRRVGETLSEHMVSAVKSKATRTASAPFFTKDPDGMLPRQCSTEFKVRPIERHVRELLGIEKGKRSPGIPVVEQWLGISWDEAIRMRPARVRYITHRYPLVEKEMHRHHCLRWMADKGYPRPPKSACVFCPYHSQDQWRSVRSSPADWQRAVAFDAAIRDGARGMRGTMFVHRQRVPLDQVDLSTPEERGQLNLFNNECEGMCGV
jgi:hypothetical protein